MVVTLENWFLGYNPFLYNKLKENIIIQINQYNKSEDLLEEIPYYFFCAEEFEEVIQVINEKGIKFYCEKFKTEKGFDAFKSFPYKTIFDNEAKEIFKSIKSSEGEFLITN